MTDNQSHDPSGLDVSSVGDSNAPYHSDVADRVRAGSSGDGSPFEESTGSQINGSRPVHGSHGTTPGKERHPPADSPSLREPSVDPCGPSGPPPFISPNLRGSRGFAPYFAAFIKTIDDVACERSSLHDLAIARNEIILLAMIHGMRLPVEARMPLEVTR